MSPSQEAAMATEPEAGLAEGIGACIEKGSSWITEEGRACNGAASQPCRRGAFTEYSPITAHACCAIAYSPWNQ